MDKTVSCGLSARATGFIATPVVFTRCLADIGLALVLPPAAELATLHDLARGGTMRDIKHYADRLATPHQRYLAFAGKFRRLADHYQSKAILMLVENALDPQVGEMSMPP